ncbi:MAG: hypothetical protein MHM6MM_002838 [Cercozoa sp. M6MM]
MSVPEGTPEFAKEVAGCAPQYVQNIGKILYTRAMIEEKVAELGATLSHEYKDKDGIVLVGLLKGVTPFMVDLARTLSVPVQLEFMGVKSYDGTESTGDVRILYDVQTDLEGKNVILIDDICDTGHTLVAVKQRLIEKNPASLRTCVLFDKKERRVHDDVQCDFVGFDCPNEFIVGYGLDFDEEYRTLPFVGVLKPSAYR